MAKKATGKKSGGSKPKKSGAKRSGSGSSSGRSSAKNTASDAFVSLLQSPLVADLVAVAATSALAALASEGFSKDGAKGTKGAGKAVKSAGKAAADAVKRRLTEEIDAIKKAAKDAKATKA